MSHWRQVSFKVINDNFIELRRQEPHTPTDDLLKRISRDHYPFGERQFHPYKMWLKVMKEYRERLMNNGDAPRRRRSRTRSVQPADPNQGSLF